MFTRRHASKNNEGTTRNVLKWSKIYDKPKSMATSTNIIIFKTVHENVLKSEDNLH